MKARSPAARKVARDVAVMRMATNSLGMIDKELHQLCAPSDWAPEPLPPACSCGGPLPCVPCETEAAADAEFARWIDKTFADESR
jgi:hypothetical protein